MSELRDLVAAYKREAAVPGTFATVFPETTDADIVGALSDAFAEAQLDGFFGSMTLDVDFGEVTPDLSVAGAALVVIYAGMRLTRQQLRSLATRTAYKAGPVEYETQRSSAALSEELKHLQWRRQQLLANAIRAGRGTGSTFVLDGYVPRANAHNFYGGFFVHEVAGGGLALRGA